MLSAEGVNLNPRGEDPPYDMYCPQAGRYPDKLNFYKRQCAARVRCEGCTSRPVPDIEKKVFFDDRPVLEEHRCRFCLKPLPAKKIGKTYNGMKIDFCDDPDCKRARKKESWVNKKDQYYSQRKTKKI